MADNLGKQLWLDSIDIGSEFVAVSGVFNDGNFFNYLNEQQEIEYVEPNQIYKAAVVLPQEKWQWNDKPTWTQQLVRSGKSLYKRAVSKVASPNWGLARLNQRENGHLEEYSFDEEAGAGIHVFVLDTGVHVEHADFENRAVVSANMVAHEDDTDFGGHGTHVAGKVAGKVYGVAKAASIHAVKILDKAGDGTTSNLIKGISHVIQVAPRGKSLINLSLSGPKSRMIDEVLSKAVKEFNIPIFVSAGNAGSDACYFSPSSNGDVFAVGATDINDEVPFYSDIGPCVRLYAPGSDIKSTWIGGLDETKTLDGTSMANPHVAGIAATLMSRKNYATASELYNDLTALATKDILAFRSTRPDMPKSNNLMAYNAVGNE
ncbi:peptidase S8/S53 domain-containing protein [Radiomyces spectabilis]|uniref:peptidase S8/S53 domain-containing protein n=1 Tax=Radiomyces spectabilis TaxID=64574 RepID=UPI00221F026F|nr:peptidase S8/S53 domain-containing protein [Radiomyces spectabilis]KAI8365367.1 peptidase S8/S53 domain-containing protein [Radiomyces spectabilis]